MTRPGASDLVAGAHLAALGAMLAPVSTVSRISTQPPPAAVFSTCCTASAPAGTGAPVMIATASPGPTVRLDCSPARTSPMTRGARARHRRRRRAPRSRPSPNGRRAACRCRLGRLRRAPVPARPRAGHPRCRAARRARGQRSVQRRRCGQASALMERIGAGHTSIEERPIFDRTRPLGSRRRRPDARPAQAPSAGDLGPLRDGVRGGGRHPHHGGARRSRHRRRRGLRHRTRCARKRCRAAECGTPGRGLRRTGGDAAHRGQPLLGGRAHAAAPRRAGSGTGRRRAARRHC